MSIWNIEEKVICVSCNKSPAIRKYLCLCGNCYRREKYRRNSKSSYQRKNFTHIFDSEKKFHSLFPNMLFHPVNFYFNESRYSPDFYDPQENVFYEVSSSPQAFYFQKRNIEKMSKYFPKIKIVVVKPDGSKYISRPRKEGKK